MSRLTEGGKQAVENRQSRHWSFTAWTDEPPSFDPETMDYLCYQQEKTEEGKTHWQGYVMLPGYGQRLLAVKKLLGPGIHVEPKMQGTTKHQLREYTRKRESAVPDTWEEYGNFDEKGAHGSNPESDYAMAIGMIMAGAKMSVVAEKYPKTVAKNHAGFKSLQFQAMLGGRPDDCEKLVKVFWGETRTGKTFAAKKYVDEHHPNSTYWLKSQKHNLWFDGYERDSCIVIDDFEGQMSIDNFLHLTDRYAGRHTWQIKGGHTRLYHNTVIITSNSHPDQWFRDEHPNKRAAARSRITTIERFHTFPLFTPKPKAPIPPPVDSTGKPFVSDGLQAKLDNDIRMMTKYEDEEAQQMTLDMNDYENQMAQPWATPDRDSDNDSSSPRAEGSAERLEFKHISPSTLRREAAGVNLPKKRSFDRIRECSGDPHCLCFDCCGLEVKRVKLSRDKDPAEILKKLRDNDSYNDPSYGKAPFCRR